MINRILSIVLLALVVASCAPADPTVVFDWCYTHDFEIENESWTVNSGEINNAQFGIGDSVLYSNSVGILSATYTHDKTVDARRIEISVSRVVGSTGDITVTSDSLFYNISADFTGTLPAGEGNVVLSFEPTGEIQPLNRDTIYLVVDSTQQFMVNSITVKGYGANPFPLNECNPFFTSTPTPIYTNTPTRTPTPAPTSTLGIATSTATPSSSPTASTTPVPQFTCSWDYRTGQLGSTTYTFPSNTPYGEYVASNGWRRGSTSLGRLSVLTPKLTGTVTSATITTSNSIGLTATGNVTVQETSAFNVAGSTVQVVFNGAVTVPSSWSWSGSASLSNEHFVVGYGYSSSATTPAMSSTFYVQTITLTGTGSVPSVSGCSNTTPTSTPVGTATTTLTPSPTATGTQTPTNTPTNYWQCLFDFTESSEGFYQFSSTKQASYTMGDGIGWQTVYDSIADPYSRSLYVAIPLQGLVTGIIANYVYTKGTNTGNTAQYNANLVSMNNSLDNVQDYLITELNPSNGNRTITYTGEFYVDYGLGFTAKSGYDGFSPFADPGGEVTLKTMAVYGQGTKPSICLDTIATPTPSPLPASYTPPTATRTSVFTPVPSTPTRTPIILATRTAYVTNTAAPTALVTGTPTAVIITVTPDGTATSIVQTATAMYGGTPSPNPSSSVTPLVGTGVSGTPYGTPVTEFGWGNECYPNCGPLSWTWGLGGLQDLLDMAGFIVQIIAGFINLIFQWIGQVITRLFALISTFWSTPAQPIPGLPQCVTAPLAHDLCAIYYIMDWTLFAPSTPGAYIIPIVVTLMNLYFVFYFIRFIYWLVKRNVKDVTDVT